jgi:hypothetical protein
MLKLEGQKKLGYWQLFKRDYLTSEKIIVWALIALYFLFGLVSWFIFDSLPFHWSVWSYYEGQARPVDG